MSFSDPALEGEQGEPEEAAEEEPPVDRPEARPVPGTVRLGAFPHSELADCENCDDMIWKVGDGDWEHVDNDDVFCLRPHEAPDQ